MKTESPHGGSGKKMSEFTGLDMSEMTDSMFKLRGFIRQKDKSYFVVRVKTQLGNVNSEQLAALSDIAGKYGRNYMTFTNRLNIDIPWVVQENLDAVKQAVEEVGLMVGGTGPTVRPIVAKRILTAIGKS